MADSRCEDVVVLDVRSVSQITDLFVIATGTSDRQIRSVAADLKLLGQTEDHKVLSLHGTESGQWVVADFVHVVVHLFEPHLRAYYDIESLWSDGRRVDWQSVTRPGQFAKLSASRVKASSQETEAADADEASNPMEIDRRGLPD